MKSRIAGVLVLCSGLAGANPGPVDYGAGTTLGNVGSGGLPGQRHNPAAQWFRLNPEQNFRSGILSFGSIGIEAGETEDFIDRVERLEGCLEEPVTVCEGERADGSRFVIRPPGDTDVDLSEGVALQDEFNEALRIIGRDAYVIIDAQFQLPATPMIFRAFDGVMGVDINATGTANISVLDDPLRFNPLTSDIETNTAAYLKTARFINASLSFAAPLQDPFQWLVPGMEMKGELSGGFRVTVMQGTLAKIIAAIDSDDGSGETAFDRAEDAYKEAEETSTGVALDLGLHWRHERYQAGLAWRNINEPGFDYGAIGVGCDPASLNPGQLRDCQVAASFAGRIDLREEFTLENQFTIDGAISFLDGQLGLSASLDLTAVDSPVGDEYQWLNLGLAWAPGNAIIPGLRLGYRSNLGENGINSIALGLTLFGVLNVDLSQALDTTTVDGDELPRSAAVSIGFELPF